MISASQGETEISCSTQRWADSAKECSPPGAQEKWQISGATAELWKLMPIENNPPYCGRNGWINPTLDTYSVFRYKPVQIEETEQMALIIRGKSPCSICDEILRDSDDLVATTPSSPTRLTLCGATRILPCIEVVFSRGASSEVHRKVQ